MKDNFGFYTDNIENPSLKSKFKFETKILVWCTISDAEFICWSCLRRSLNCRTLYPICLSTLLLFLNTHHANDDIFWSDLALYHYARATRNLLNANNIYFVPKLGNPPSVPQVRSIKDFWSILQKST